MIVFLEAGVVKKQNANQTRVKPEIQTGIGWGLWVKFGPGLRNNLSESSREGGG